MGVCFKAHSHFFCLFFYLSVFFSIFANVKTNNYLLKTFNVL